MHSVSLASDIPVILILFLYSQGIPPRVQYWPGSGRQELFPVASLELCSVPCEVGDVGDVVASWHHIGSEIWPSLINISQFERVF